MTSSVVSWCNKGEVRTRWIGAACLVAMGVGAIDQCLVGEIELGRPVDGGAARKLVPLLIHDAGDVIAVAGNERVRLGYRRNASCPRSSARRRSVSDRLRHCNKPRRNRHRNSAIGILAEEIIVSFIVQTGEMDWGRCKSMVPTPSCAANWLRI